jgi:hypothetical protein
MRLGVRAGGCGGQVGGGGCGGCGADTVDNTGGYDMGGMAWWAIVLGGAWGGWGDVVCGWVGPGAWVGG